MRCTLVFCGRSISKDAVYGGSLWFLIDYPPCQIVVDWGCGEVDFDLLAELLNWEPKEKGYHYNTTDYWLEPQ